ncbi:hypothetical protein C8R44DRAFT_753110 [Mycena epipterygia]|nr:hypothetical protein C8R44DRAFT_753110 [Mycena epipterygia]
MSAEEQALIQAHTNKHSWSKIFSVPGTGNPMSRRRLYEGMEVAHVRLDRINFQIWRSSVRVEMATTQARHATARSYGSDHSCTASGFECARSALTESPTASDLRGSNDTTGTDSNLKLRGIGGIEKAGVGLILQQRRDLEPVVQRGFCEIQALLGGQSPRWPEENLGSVDPYFSGNTPVSAKASRLSVPHREHPDRPSSVPWAPITRYSSADACSAVISPVPLPVVPRKFGDSKGIILPGNKPQTAQGFRTKGGLIQSIIDPFYSTLKMAGLPLQVLRLIAKEACGNIEKGPNA